MDYLLLLKELIYFTLPHNQNYEKSKEIIWLWVTKKIVRDNSKTHKSTEIHQLIENAQVKILALTSYWPFLNPSEYLIGTIKEKIRSKNGSDRLFHTS